MQPQNDNYRDVLGDLISSVACSIGLVKPRTLARTKTDGDYLRELVEERSRVEATLHWADYDANLRALVEIDEKICFLLRHHGKDPAYAEIRFPMKEAI